MAVDLNTVPLGQAGTGAAFVLGNSQAADQFAQTQARNQQYAYQNALRQQQEAAKKAALWQQNALKVEGGLYWKPEFDKMYQTHLEDGIKLRQAGINPYDYNPNDPNQAQKAEPYLLERERILQDTKNRKATETEIAKRFSAITTNPSKYEPEDIDALNEYINTPYSQAKNIPVPTLREAFNVDRDLVAKLDPVTFQTSKTVGNTKIDENKMLVEPTKRNIETLIADTDTGKRWIKRQTGLTPSEAKNIPDTFEANKKRLMEEYKGNPDMRTKLAAQFGITGESQELDDLLNQQAMEDVRKKQAYNGVINQYTELARAKANEFVKTNPDFRIEDQAMQREGLQLRREANNRERVKFNERGRATSQGEAEDLVIPFADGKGVAEGKGYVKVPMATKNFAGTKGAIDLSTGKPVDLTNSSNDYQVVGVANFPFINKEVKDNAGNSIPKGSLAQPNFAKGNSDIVNEKPMIHVQLKEGDLVSDYLVPFDRMPQNLTKNDKAILSSFKPATGSNTTQSTNKQKELPKSVTSKFKNVPKGGF